MTAPSNLLERALLAAREGKVSMQVLVETLLASPVFVLLDREPPKDGRLGPETRPLVLANAAGQTVFAVFTAPERANAWLQREPDFRHGLMVDFRWLLPGIADGVGLVVNPGTDLGFEMPAANVQVLKDSVAGK